MDAADEYTVNHCLERCWFKIVSYVHQLPDSLAYVCLLHTVRSYIYSPPEDAGNDAMLSHCLVTSCYNSNNTNSSNVCDSSYCEMKTPVPTVPDIDNHYWFFRSHHWFFDFFLYIGGSIHLMMSLGMAVSYFLINATNFVLPDFVYDFLMDTGKSFLPSYIMYVS